MSQGTVQSAFTNGKCSRLQVRWVNPLGNYTEFDYVIECKTILLNSRLPDFTPTVREKAHNLNSIVIYRLALCSIEDRKEAK